MSTALKLGQEDHGRALTMAEYEAAEYDSGHKYELIEGRLYVSPLPNMPHASLILWLQKKLILYSMAHPAVINEVSPFSRVFLPGEPEETCPEPDLTAYADFPHHLPIAERDWREYSPVLAVEFVSEDDPDKDLVRNVRLYREVPRIREYWIFDPRENADQPSLLVYRRGKRGWQRPIRIPGGGTYTTPLLPGFSLLLDGHT
jgi:Uma2 family endonuclease